MEMLPPWNPNRQGSLHDDAVNAQLRMLYQSELNVIASSQNRQVPNYTDSRMKWSSVIQPATNCEGNNYVNINVNKMETKSSRKHSLKIATELLTPSPQKNDGRQDLREGLIKMAGNDSEKDLMRINSLTPPGLSYGQHYEREKNHHQYSSCSPQRSNLAIIETPPLDDSLQISPKSDNEDFTIGNLWTYKKEELDESDDEYSSFYKPQYNSHGKIKIYKCKHCDFVANTKAAEWKHKVIHMKSEKIMKCPYYPKCPFVTEYKQHFDYHKRDHNKEKPFRCERCEYSCKNKAMLTSHMKSHSGINPYNCKTCGYATKHCHQLKLHLRKYNHDPGDVLNEDGNPDPSIMIDVNGRRRGPKRRKLSGDELLQSSLLQDQQQLYSQLDTSPKTVIRSTQMERSSNSLVPNALPAILQQNGSIHPNVVLPYLQMLANHQAVLARIALEHSQESNEIVETHNSKILCDNQMAPKKVENKAPEEADIIRINSPNKLSFSQQNNYVFNIKQKEDSDNIKRSSSDGFKRCPNSIPQKSVTISRQKSNEIKSPCRLENNITDSTPNPRVDKVSNNNPLYSCKHCDIYFSNAILHSLHMGCHSLDNDFKCNMCGEQCDNATQFFIHLARKAHNATQS